MTWWAEWKLCLKINQKEYIYIYTIRSRINYINREHYCNKYSLFRILNILSIRRMIDSGPQLFFFLVLDDETRNRYFWCAQGQSRSHIITCKSHGTDWPHYTWNRCNRFRLAVLVDSINSGSLDSKNTKYVFICGTCGGLRSRYKNF